MRPVPILHIVDEEPVSPLTWLDWGCDAAPVAAIATEL
jgi:hypothetical protein